MNELRTKAEEISKEIRTEMGDVGSCILGYDLLVDGKQFISQPAQGGSTCYKVYKTVTAMLIENGVDESRIVIDEGRMD